MTDEAKVFSPAEKSRQPVVLYILLAIATIIAITAVYLVHDLRGHVTALEEKQQASEATIKVLQDKLHLSDAQVAQNFEALGNKVGMTQADIQARTAELRQQQAASESKLTGLSAEQQKTQQQVAGVSSEVGAVKNDLGGAKSDISAARNDINATREQLTRMQGDMGQMSGLIAHNHDELEVLKHRGDRNYYEFTLAKGAKTNVGPIALQLKKADPKKSRFTLNVMADDKVIEKKDRTLNEPLQFYSGRDRMLYELVINAVNKNQVVGYLSTPK
jgi:hypothetical protein